MAFCRVLLPMLVLSVAQCFATVEVPVFLWGNLARNSLKHNALTPVPFREFGAVLKHELQGEPLVVVFMEETLSVEDFSLKTDGETSYPYLRSKVGNAVYLPSVESPRSVLNKFGNADMVEHVELTDEELSEEIEADNGKIVFVNLMDAREGETRPELLRRHDEFMKKTVSQLQLQNENVIAIYTAHYPSWTLTTHSRVRRQADGNNTVPPVTDSPTTYTVDGLRVYFQGVYLRINDTETPLVGVAAGESIFNDTVGNSTFNFNNTDVSVRLNFASYGGYWYLDSAQLKTPSFDEILQTREDVFAILGFSYRCSHNVSFATYNETIPYLLTFQNIRVQPFITGNETQFGDMFNCVGFFTVPIWAGIFVVSILLAIFFYGVMMMMDIRTMDRFDDPKGKTITINAE